MHKYLLNGSTIWHLNNLPVCFPIQIKKQSAAENTLNKDYPGGSVTTTKDDNTKEMDNTDHEKKEEGVMGWKAELLKFKAEAEEFNAELEKAMVRRRHCMTTI